MTSDTSANVIKLTNNVKAERRLPGDSGVWAFILAELSMFGVFFIAFMVSRHAQINLFNASQLKLDLRLGALNTLILITSSWAVASAVAAARADRSIAAARYLTLAIVFSLAFMAVKYFEYSAKFNIGVTMLTNDFFMFYFCLTFIHLGHVIGGTIILAVMRNNANIGQYRSGATSGIEAGASYWHLVDLLWIFLFTLLYLLR